MAMDSIQKHGTVLKSFVNDVMLACQSLRSIHLHCNVYFLGKLIGSIFAKRQLQHLTFAGGFLSEEDCAHIKRLLADEKCVLRSLTLGNCLSMCDRGMK